VTDILEDLKKRLADIGFVDANIEKVIMQVRKDYAGDRVYIGVNYEFQRKHSERNRSIIRDYKSGESIVFLSRRYSLSKQRIWKIING
jgi:Mor family transcriptional regulator